MPESSIVIKAEDKYSDAIKRMSTVTKSFNKDQDAMEAKLKKLRENQHALQDELKKSADQLKTLQKQYEATGDAAIKSDRDAAQANYDKIKRNLDLVTKGAREAEKQMQKTGKSFTASGNSAKSSFSDIMKAMAASGIGQMAGQLAQQASTAWVTSAFGDDAGSIFSSTVSSGLSGAAMGFAMGSIPGAIIGGAIGTVAGIGSGLLGVETKKDDYFKSYYNGIIDEQTQRRAAAIQSGSSIAAGRQTDKISFTTLFGNDKAKAEKYLNDLVNMANTTPFLYDDLTAMSKTLATYGYGADDILPVLTKIGDTGAALGMNTSDMTMVATALGRMKSSDKATLEYLNILNDRGIGAVQMLAEGKKVSVGKMYEMISQGEIKGSEAAKIILDAMEEDYKDTMVEQSETFAGKTSTLTGWKQEMENSYGMGYNDTRMEGVQAEINAYDGSLGTALKEQNKIEGSLAAHRENLQEQYTREALSAVLAGRKTTLFDADQTTQLETMGRQYDELSKIYEKTRDKEIGLKLENLRDQAEALAKEAFDSSEWAKKELSAQEENTAAIRELTAAFDGWEAQYHAEQETTKGRGATVKFVQSGYGINGADYAFSESPGTSGATGRPMVNLTDSSNLDEIMAASGRSHAAGLARVPYDGYAAILHEGERVLTAQQARERDSGGGVVVNVSGNQFTVRSDADIDAIAQAFAEQIRLERQAGNL